MMATSTATATLSNQSPLTRTGSFPSCGSLSTPNNSTMSSSAMQIDDVSSQQDDGDGDSSSTSKPSKPIAIPKTITPQPHPQHQVTIAGSSLPNTPTLTPTPNVGELVSKAKKAASSLWMILHAQNCSNGTCPHRGCYETKLLLLHVKSCSVGSGLGGSSSMAMIQPPCSVKGCNETRKLLAHYHKCKAMRMNQQQQGATQQQQGATQQQQQQQPDQSCLICSLMARHAKSMLEREESLSLQQQLDHDINDMPPPPPRSVGMQSTMEMEMMNDHNDNAPCQEESTTPSSSSKLAALASIASVLSPNISSTPPTSNTTASYLSKSVPNNNTITAAVAVAPILRKNSRDSVPSSYNGGETGMPTRKTNSIKHRRRPRAESYDERKTRVKFAPGVFTTGGSLKRQNNHYFDTNNNNNNGMHECGEAEEEPMQHQHEEMQYQMLHSSPTRPRSASLGSHNTASSTSDSSEHDCETIAEEGMFGNSSEQSSEQPIFDMD